MNIVFMGSDVIGVPTLERLHREYDLRLVVTQPDRPAGRKRKLTPTATGQWAAERNIPCIKPEKLNQSEWIQLIADCQPDVIVVIAYGQWISKKITSLARLETINLHGSLLPRWRGAAPINWSIISGDHEVGVTVMTVVKHMDAGDMLGKTSIPADPLMTAGDLHQAMGQMGPDLMVQVIESLNAGTANFQKQDESLVTVADKLSREDTYLDFTQDALTLRRWIHGLTPWPGVSFLIQNDSKIGAAPIRVKLGRVKDHEGQGHTDEELGQMIRPGLFAMGQGAIEILELQPAGKKMMSWDSFANGHQLTKARLMNLDK